MSHARALALTAIALAVTVSLVGCGAIAQQATEKATEKAIEGATGGKVDVEEDSVTIEGEDGGKATFSEGAEVPADFPSDVPVYEGTIKAAVEAKDAFTLAIVTQDSPSDVLDWYVEKLTDEGWKREAKMATGEGGVYSAKKGDSAVQVVVASGSGDAAGDTSISLTVTTGSVQ